MFVGERALRLLRGSRRWAETFLQESGSPPVFPQHLFTMEAPRSVAQKHFLCPRGVLLPRRLPLH